MSYTIHVVDCPHGIDSAIIKSVVTSVLQQSTVEQGELSIAFIDDEAMRELNRDFRGMDTATDVLSFPADNTIPDEDGYIGDIAIALETSEAQATQLGHSFQTEVLQLAIHGVLHLIGFDHETDSGEMDRRELELRASLLEGIK